ncbi:FAD-dependent oxidoreductase [Chitinophaga qingshengii]|uniref:FAD-dependent oxidoreductase n=1 Tax=Chitinophaga qingshengii TaxID=1569794 RepID=A0ABR7TI33_9BACT|nr:FAD-dependent oxidoreductase [Chitinophaga qingshengii]MBC9929127.1 FAD-dependent oxidoreductase [Chitinophaga qingshengii]
MDELNRRNFIRKTGILAMGAVFPFTSSINPDDYDIVVYGGTSGGVMAAIQAARMGKKVALIEPGKHLGGLTSGGLGWVDVGDPHTIGGLSREYFHRVWQHYQADKAWKWEQKHPMAEQHPPLAPDDQTMWIVEPSVAEHLFDQMAAEAKVTIVRNERLNCRSGVEMKERNITRIRMESGRMFRAKMFIDATYEGDLMAAAGVSYTVGREPNSRYGEKNNGIRPLPLPGRFPEGIDPYRVKGDPASGLLPRVYPDWGGKVGEGDKGVQAYNYRLCLTKVPENRVFIEKPAGYHEEQYELLFRFIEAGGMEGEFFKTAFGGSFLKLDLLPNGKTDTNNNGYISTDFVGMNWAYPEADYATRERMARLHEQWQRGLIWTLQHHPRIPEAVRRQYAPWGLAKDEFTDTGHWPFQLYIREARRMISDVVITEHTALGKEVAADPVGLGSYHMDSHAIKLFVSPKGFVTSEGGMFVHIPAPFGISYRAIIPKRGECGNLLVPICVSVTHAAYGSVRMEPVFMVLGQSAATAASLAIDLHTTVQEVPYDLLRARLLKDKQLISDI